ncbi:MAG: LysR substrate-binding domain-containing protein, partial [Alphaproteobacteria bacterium]
ETLIGLEDEHWHWMNWRQWLTSHGVEAAVGRPAITIESYPLVIDAARRGLGIALGWRGLVDDDLATGRLVAPLSERLRSRFGYHVAWPRERRPSPEAADFIAWVATPHESASVSR